MSELGPTVLPILFYLVAAELIGTLKAPLVRRGLAVPVLTSTLAACSLIGGWVMFSQGSPPVPRPPRDASRIEVFTDDPRARIDIELDVSLLWPKIYDGQPPPLLLKVAIRPSRETPIRWAIVLGEDVALPESEGEPAGSALPHGESRRPEDVWVKGDIQEAWFVRKGGHGIGSTLLGTSAGVEKGGAISISVESPTRGPFIYDSGQYYTLYLPALGMMGTYGSTESAKVLRNYRGTPFPLSLESTVKKGEVPEALRVQLEETAWYHPVSYNLAAGVGGHDFEDRLVQASPPPEAPKMWRWRAKNGLFVQAVAERPSRIAQAQRSQFLAGVLAGIGGGFLIWSLELWYTRPRPTGELRGQRRAISASLIREKKLSKARRSR